MIKTHKFAKNYKKIAKNDNETQKICCNLTHLVVSNLRSIQHTLYLPKNEPKIAKRWVIWHSKICPLEMIFFFCFPTHLLGLSERYILDPQTLIGDFVFMEIWLKQNRPFSQFSSKYQFFHRSRYDRSDRSKLRQNEGSYEKNW